MIDGLPTPRAVETLLGPVQVADFGDPGGPAVLVLHGTPGGWDHAVLLGEFLAARGFRVLAPSRPGYLGTPLRYDTRSFDGQAEWCTALLTACGVARAGILSWSGAGPVGFRTAVLYPERVRAHVAFAALPVRYDWRIPWHERLLLGTRAGVGLVHAAIRRAPERVVAATVRTLGDLPRDELQRRVAEISADPVRRRFVLGIAAGGVTWGPRHPGTMNDKKRFAGIVDLELERTTVPTLVVQGDADSQLTLAETGVAAERIPAAASVTMRVGTHLCLYTDPGHQQVQDTVARFLA